MLVFSYWPAKYDELKAVETREQWAVSTQPTGEIWFIDMPFCFTRLTFYDIFAGSERNLSLAIFFFAVFMFTVYVNFGSFTHQHTKYIFFSSLPFQLFLAFVKKIKKRIELGFHLARKFNWILIESAASVKFNRQKSSDFYNLSRRKPSEKRAKFVREIMNTTHLGLYKSPSSNSG